MAIVLSISYNRTFRIFTASMIALLLIPSLVQDGMFLDGITYSTISRNMANGIGSFWHPHYTETLYPHFNEHPPLIFIIQTFFFKFLGDSFVTERLFCLVISILNVIGISKCWRLIHKQTEYEVIEWLPVFLMFTVPLVSWSYKNNLLENTLSCFTIFAIFFILKSILEQRLVYLIFASAFIDLAFLSKGFVGIFPFAFPIFYALIFKEWRNSIYTFLYLVIFTFLFLMLLLILFPDLKTNLTNYFNEQLLPALKNKREITTGNRFSIIGKLFTEIAFPILALILFSLLQRKNNFKVDLNIYRKSLLFLSTAFSASCPLIISLKQRNFYLIPSIPFFVLAISIIIVPILKIYLEKINFGHLKIVRFTSFAICAIVLAFSIINFGKPSRDHAKLEDIYRISASIPKGTILAATKDLCYDWSLIAYLYRIGYLSLDCTNDHDYILSEIHNHDTLAPQGYEYLDLELIKYRLLKRVQF